MWGSLCGRKVVEHCGRIPLELLQHGTGKYESLNLLESKEPVEVCIWTAVNRMGMKTAVQMKYCSQAGCSKAEELRFQGTTYRQHRGCIIPQAVTQSNAPENGRNHRPKHVELIGTINKPLLLYVVGCLYYWYCITWRALLNALRKKRNFYFSRPQLYQYNDHGIPFLKRRYMNSKQDNYMEKCRRGKFVTRHFPEFCMGIPIKSQSNLIRKVKVQIGTWDLINTKQFRYLTPIFVE